MAKVTSSSHFTAVHDTCTTLYLAMPSICRETAVDKIISFPLSTTSLPLPPLSFSSLSLSLSQHYLFPVFLACDITNCPEGMLCKSTGNMYATCVCPEGKELENSGSSVTCIGRCGYANDTASLRLTSEVSDRHDNTCIYAVCVCVCARV